MGPVHYDAIEAQEILLRNGNVEEELAPGELQEAIVAQEQALDDIAAVEKDEDDDLRDDHNAPFEA